METTFQTTVLHIPRQICNTCNNPSGPSMELTRLPDDTELLRTNIIPSATYLDTSTPAKVASDLDLLGAEITDLKNVLASLELRRSELQKFRDQRSSVLAPIRRLPEDVLGYIFLFCQRNWSEDHGAVTICNPTTFVRVITRVCSFWRSVALNYHLLWSNVYIDFHVKRGRNITDVLRMIGPFLRECIQRSGQTPLTLKFSRTCTPKIFSLDVLEELAQCAWRWEDIQIGWELLEKVQNEFNDSVPCSPFLKRLTILDDVLGSQHLVFQRDMPSLSEISIRGFTNPVHRLTFPWVQVTSFTSDSNIFEQEELHVLLTSMPNLTTLKFFGYTGRQAAQVAIPLPKLHSLDLSGDYVQIINQLTSFTTPRLKNLKLDCGTSFLGELYSSSILPFLRRSKCHLETLNLHGIPVNNGWDDEEVRTVTRLEVHRLSNDRFAEDLWWLTRDETDPPSLNILPNLEYLELHFEHDVDYTFAITELIATLNSRFVPEESGKLGELAYLKEVEVRFARELRGTQVDMARDFLRGLDMGDRKVKVVFMHGFVVNGRWGEGMFIR